MAVNWLQRWGADRGMGRISARSAPGGGCAPRLAGSRGRLHDAQAVGRLAALCAQMLLNTGVQAVQFARVLLRGIVPMHLEMFRGERKHTRRGHRTFAARAQREASGARTARMPRIRV